MALYNMDIIYPGSAFVEVEFLPNFLFFEPKFWFQLNSKINVGFSVVSKNVDFSLIFKET